MTIQTCILLCLLFFLGAQIMIVSGIFLKIKTHLKQLLQSKSLLCPRVDTAFKLDFFNEIPDTISGCGEYFTHDTVKLAMAAIYSYLIYQIRNNKNQWQRHLFKQLIP